MKRRTLLRAARAAKQPKVTQAQLARKAGIGSFRIWQIENGEGQPVSDDEKDAVAAALDLRVSDIDWPSDSSARERAS
jgi:DNA-binding XRE family transcriptional regulator